MPAALTQAELLAGEPPEAGPPADGAARILASLRGRKLVVLDDDPTGTQAVHGVPVVTRWQPDDLDWLLSSPAPVGFVLTNSRSLDRTAAGSLNADLAEGLLSAGTRAGVQVELISRGDSTLRGHFPTETDVLAAAAARRGSPVDVLLLCPSFPEAGRVTVGDVHWVRGDDGYRPAGATEYAQDAAFGYRSSDLREWVEERTDGRVPAGSVASVSLADVRVGGPVRVADVLCSLDAGTCVVANAVVRADLDILALGVALARERGLRCLHRCGPSFVGALAGLPLRAPLTAAELTGPPLRGRLTTDELPAGSAGRHHGLVLVGSHTALSTRQLERAVRGLGLASVELDVDAVLTDADAEVSRVAQRMEEARTEGDVVVSTSRTRRDAGGADASLALARSVSRALVGVVSRLDRSRPPRYLVAKGGITSSDIATQALGVRRAEVLGQMIAGGLPVWRLPEGSPAPGAPYVIFPGNVGDERTLLEVLATLRRIPAA